MDPAAQLETAQAQLEDSRPAQALRTLKGAFPRELRLEAEFLRAEALRSQGFFDKAVALYETVLRGAGADRGLTLEAALGLASVHRSLGEARQARARLSQARSAAGGADARVTLEDALIDRVEGRWAVCLRKL